jgi:hypothetical protein
VDVTVVARGGVTTIRVEEELRDVAGALIGGLVGGGGGGTTGITVGIGMSQFHSAPIALMLWLGAATGFYLLARTIFGNISEKREKQLKGLADRLESEVTEAIESKRAQIGASTPRSLAAATEPPTTG